MDNVKLIPCLPEGICDGLCRNPPRNLMLTAVSADSWHRCSGVPTPTSDAAARPLGDITVLDCIFVIWLFVLNLPFCDLLQSTFWFVTLLKQALVSSQNFISVTGTSFASSVVPDVWTCRKYLSAVNRKIGCKTRRNQTQQTEQSTNWWNSFVVGLGPNLNVNE